MRWGSDSSPTFSRPKPTRETVWGFKRGTSRLGIAGVENLRKG